MKGFDLIDLIKKEWHKRGTASYPVLFIDQENDCVLQFANRIETDQDGKVTYVYVQPVE